MSEPSEPAPVGATDRKAIPTPQDDRYGSRSLAFDADDVVPSDQSRTVDAHETVPETGNDGLQRLPDEVNTVVGVEFEVVPRRVHVGHLARMKADDALARSEAYRLVNRTRVCVSRA